MPIGCQCQDSSNTEYPPCNKFSECRSGLYNFYRATQVVPFQAKVGDFLTPGAKFCVPYNLPDKIDDALAVIAYAAVGIVAVSAVAPAIGAGLSSVPMRAADIAFAIKGLSGVGISLMTFAGVVVEFTM